MRVADVNSGAKAGTFPALRASSSAAPARSVGCPEGAAGQGESLRSSQRTRSSSGRRPRLCWAGGRGRAAGLWGGPPPLGTPASKPGAALPRGGGARRVRPWGGRQVRSSRSPRLGGALGRGIAGSAGGKERVRGWRGCRGAGRRRGRRGGGGGAPGIHSPSAGLCTPSRGRHPPRSQLGAETSSGPALRRRARSPATTDGGGPSQAPRAQGLPPARPRAPLPDHPRPLSSGDPGRRAGSPPGGSPVRGLRDPGPPGEGRFRCPRGVGSSFWGAEQTPRRAPQSGARGSTPPAQLRAADEESGAGAGAARSLRGAGRICSERPRRGRALQTARRRARPTQRSRALEDLGRTERPARARGPARRRDMQVSARLPAVVKGAGGPPSPPPAPGPRLSPPERRPRPGFGGRNFPERPDLAAPWASACARLPAAGRAEGRRGGSGERGPALGGEPRGAWLELAAPGQVGGRERRGKRSAPAANKAGATDSPRATASGERAGLGTEGVLLAAGR